MTWLIGQAPDGVLTRPNLFVIFRAWSLTLNSHVFHIERYKNEKGIV